MVFGRQNKKKKFYLGEKELKIIESYKYLGLVLDRNFSFKARIEKNLEKARKRVRARCGLGLREGVSARGGR